jgi:RNA polymerase sigma-70 factor (ECF subfamily)
MIKNITDSDCIDIINKYQHLIVRVCRIYSNNTDNLKDFQQEVIVKLWLNLKKNFNDIDKIECWIYRVIINTCISYYRKEKAYSQKKAVLTEDLYELPDTNDDELFKEYQRLLYKYIDDFSELDKALIFLYLENNSHKEIADILGISETNVSTKIYRLKERLKKLFVKI